MKRRRTDFCPDNANPKVPLPTRLGSRGLLRAGLCLVFVVAGLEGCREPSPELGPVTITLLDPGWLDKEFIAWRSS